MDTENRLIAVSGERVGGLEGIGIKQRKKKRLTDNRQHYGESQWEEKVREGRRG